jgi:hypothetical protein
MQLKKIFIQRVFEETKELFEKEIIKLPYKVELEYESKENFLNNVKANPLIKQQIQFGIYKDIDKEYVGFAVVYERNKLPLRQIMELPYLITICYDIAKEVFKPFKSNEVKSYLIHTFAHELVHLFEDEIKNKKPELWNTALERAYNKEEYAKELFPELVSDIITKDIKTYRKVEKQIWSKTLQRVEKMKKQRGL